MIADEPDFNPLRHDPEFIAPHRRDCVIERLVACIT